MNIAHRFIHTVTVAARSSVDGYGDPSYGSTSTIKARVERNTKTITNLNGEEVTPDHRFMTASTVSDTQAIWLPGDSTSGKPRRIQLVESVPSLDGDLTLYMVYV